MRCDDRQGEIRNPDQREEEMPEQPKCVEIFDRGVSTSQELLSGLSALMGDVATGRLTARDGNAICNVAGKILKTAQLAHQFGLKEASGAEAPMLRLVAAAGATPAR
jgi:hypothetical protein